MGYASPLYADVQYKTYEIDEDGKRKENRTGNNDRASLGTIPMMLRSNFCHLNEKSRSELPLLGECPYDQGGYFIINGSEKVLVAQEKMSNNHVYVFKKSHPTKYSYVAE